VLNCPNLEDLTIEKALKQANILPQIEQDKMTAKMSLKMIRFNRFETVLIS